LSTNKILTILKYLQKITRYLQKKFLPSLNTDFIRCCVLDQNFPISIRLSAGNLSYFSWAQPNFFSHKQKFWKSRKTSAAEISSLLLQLQELIISANQ